MSAPHEQGALGPESVTTTQTTADRLNWLQGLAQSELRKSLDRRKHLPPQILTAGIANEISAEIRAAIDCHRPGQYSSWVRGNHLGDMQVTVGVPSWPDEPASAPASGAERMTAGEVWFRLPPEQKPIKGFPNRAGQTDTDDAIAAELEGAGIEVYRLELLRKTSGEVKTAVRGGLHGWSFTRAWRYWIAEGPGIELAAADILHAAHPSTVRVNGHCGCPSPREQNLGLAIGSYHVDSQAGLKGLADTIKALVERPATPASATPSGVPDSVREDAQKLVAELKRRAAAMARERWYSDADCMKRAASLLESLDTHPAGQSAGSGAFPEGGTAAMRNSAAIMNGQPAPVSTRTGDEGTEDLKGRIYKVLRDYSMSNMSDRDDGGAYPLVDLCTPDGRPINEGEDELGIIASEIAWSLAARPASPEAQGAERVRHVKRGTEYEVLGEAEAQISTQDYQSAKVCGEGRRILREGEKLTVYRGSDGKLWCRFTDEFRDGRFMPAPPSSGQGGR